MKRWGTCDDAPSKTKFSDFSNSNSYSKKPSSTLFICFYLLGGYSLIILNAVSRSKPSFSASLKIFMIFVCFRDLCNDLNFPWYPSTEHYHSGIHEPLECLLRRSAPSRSCFLIDSVLVRFSQGFLNSFGPFSSADWFLSVDPYYHVVDNLFFLLFQFYLPLNFFDYGHDSLLSPYPHSIYPKVESYMDLSVL